MPPLNETDVAAGASSADQHEPDAPTGHARARGVEIALILLAAVVHLLYSPWPRIPMLGPYLLPRAAFGWSFPESLVLLHAQPPMLNILTFLVYGLEDLTGIGEGMILRAMQCLLTAAALLLWFSVLRGVGLGLATRIAFAALLITHPMNLFYFDHLNHTSLGPALTGLMAFAGWRYFSKPSARRAAWLAGILALMTLTRTIWHPGFVGPAVILAWLYGRRTELPRAPLLGALVLPLVPVAIWLVKNHLLFGVMGMSSWTGWNLGGENVRNFYYHRQHDRAIVDAYYAGRPRLREWFEEAPATSIMTLLPAETDPACSTNCNHYVVPALNKADLDERMRYFREDPSRYVSRVRWHLYYFNLRPFENPYLYDVASGRGSDLRTPSSFHAYLALHAAVYQGTWLGERMVFKSKGIKYRPSLMPQLLPLVFLAAMGVAVLARRRLTAAVRAQLLLLGWSGFCFLATVLLTDGAESARMRWEVEPLGWACVMLLMLAMKRPESPHRG